MKTWEMIKEVMENPKKRFTCPPHRIEVGFHDSFLIWFDHKETPFRIIRPDEDWTEVKQSVTWQEALEAWSVGKTVKCMQGGYSYIYSNREQLFIDNRTRNTMSKYDLKEGTWYIEN